MNTSHMHPNNPLSKVSPVLLNTLQRIETQVGFDLDISCMYRSVQWEKEHGRDGGSSHCKGLAVDIRVKDNYQRFKLVQAAINLGVSRLGIYPSFVHIDIDSNKPQSRIWYGS